MCTTDMADELFRRVHPDDVDASRNAISVMFSKHHGAVCIYRTLNEKTHKYLWLHASGRSIEERSVTAGNPSIVDSSAIVPESDSTHAALNCRRL